MPTMSWIGESWSRPAQTAVPILSKVLVSEPSNHTSRWIEAR